MGDFDYQFLIEVLVGGLLSGVMYSLVAIGFVLIYKTSGVLNFAQGSMLLFAALTFVSLIERHVPFALALAVTFAVMVLLGIAIERLVLRPLVNKPPITLFMATLGLAYVIEGAAQLMWGTQVHGLDLGIEDAPFEVGGVLISKFDLFAAGVAATMVAVLTAFFRYTRAGLSFRAVADDQFSALAVGLRLSRTWAIVWSAAGFVALVAGLALGRATRCAVLLVTRGPEGTAGAGARRIQFDPRRDRRRPSRRRDGEAGRGLYRPIRRRRHRDLVRLRRRARRSCWYGHPACSARSRSRGSERCHPPPPHFSPCPGSGSCPPGSSRSRCWSLPMP